MVESLPTLDDRSYRKNLTSTGLIYLGAVEHEIRLLNLSLTGLLAELKYDEHIHDVKDIFQALQVSTMIDIYLPDMRLAGEAEVVRVKPIDSGFHIGVEFRNLSYDIDNLLYNRKAYRKNMNAPGHIVFNDCDYTFQTENVSVYGLMIRIPGRIEVEAGTISSFDFKHLDLRGEVEVVWVDRDYNSTLMGLQYLHMQRDNIKGIPRFVRPQQSSGDLSDGMDIGKC